MKAVMRMSVCAWFALACVQVGTAVAKTLNVPAQYATIPAAIDAAQPGDEVVLADGVYTGMANKNLDFGGKAIIVRTTSGNAANCIIGGEGRGRGFSVRSDETAAAVVQGLTTRNEWAGSRGGVMKKNNLGMCHVNATVRA